MPNRITLSFFLLCVGSALFAHEGTGEPIIADIVVPTEIAKGEPVQIILRLFSMEKVQDPESVANDVYIINAVVEKGSRNFEIVPEMVSDQEFRAEVTFPSSGVWTIKAHVSKKDSRESKVQDGDPSIVELTIRVDGPSTKRNVVFYALVLLGALGVITGTRGVARRRKS